MGESKLFLEVGGESLLRRATQAALSAGLDPVVVVVGPESERARNELSGLGCVVAVNPQPERGQGSSLATGLAALPADVGAVVVVLPDMPRVTPAMIGALASRWRETGAALVVSDYQGTVAPPVLFAGALLGDLSAAKGEHPGKAVIARHRPGAEVVRWPAEALADVDTPGDVAALKDKKE